MGDASNVAYDERTLGDVSLLADDERRLHPHLHCITVAWFTKTIEDAPEAIVEPV